MLLQSLELWGTIWTIIWPKSCRSFGYLWTNCEQFSHLRRFLLHLTSHVAGWSVTLRVSLLSGLTLQYVTHPALTQLHLDNLSAGYPCVSGNA